MYATVRVHLYFIVLNPKRLFTAVRACHIKARGFRGSPVEAKTRATLLRVVLYIHLTFLLCTRASCAFVHFIQCFIVLNLSDLWQ